MENITFKKATATDAPIIEQLAHRIWKIHYPDIVAMAQLDYMLAKWYTVQALQKQMEGGQIFTMVYADAEPIGYMGITEQTPHHFFINKFYVDTARHRVGIGSQAFRYLLDTYCQGFETISLQVNRRNVKAVNFYFKMGMTIEYQKDFDIGEGYSMDDFVMVLKPRKPSRVRPIAIALIRRGNEILVFKDYDAHRDMHYCRPLGGGVEFRELSGDALKREFVEELNEEITDLKLLTFSENIFTLYGKEYHELVFVYEARFVNKEAYHRNDLKIIDDPKVSVHWVNVEDFKSGKLVLVPEVLMGFL